MHRKPSLFHPFTTPAAKRPRTRTLLCPALSQGHVYRGNALPMTCLAHNALATPARTRRTPKAVRTPCTRRHARHGLARPLFYSCFYAIHLASCPACTHPSPATHGNAHAPPTHTPSTACTATAPQHTTQPRRQRTPPARHMLLHAIGFSSCTICMMLQLALTGLTSHVQSSAQFRKETPWLRPWEKATISHQYT